MSLDLYRHIKLNNVKKIKELLDEGANINEKTNDGRTPLLHYMYYWNNNIRDNLPSMIQVDREDFPYARMLRFLVINGANYSEGDNNGTYPRDLYPDGPETFDKIVAKAENPLLRNRMIKAAY